MQMSQLSIEESVDFAKEVVAMRPSQLVLKVQDLMFRRELSRTVAGLNSLVLDHPKHKHVATEALARMGLWTDLATN